MNDYDLWNAATDLDGLGKLGALWLLGEIDRHPVYPGGPDDETQPIAEALAALNRAGVVTVGSQPGGFTPWHVTRAYVSGYITERQLDRLRRVLPGSATLLVREDRPRWFARTSWTPPMAQVDGREVGHLPRYRLTRRGISAQWGHQLNNTALDALEGMAQVHVFPRDLPQSKMARTAGLPRVVHDPIAENHLWVTLDRLAQFDARNDGTSNGGAS